MIGRPTTRQTAVQIGLILTALFFAFATDPAFRWAQWAGEAVAAAGIITSFAAIWIFIRHSKRRSN
jgi:hypothetical protein